MTWPFLKTRRLRKLLVDRGLFLFFAFFAFPAFAQQALPPSSGAPVEISAAKALVWDRKAQTYTAQEDAIVRQGNLSVSARTLIAHYRDGKGGVDIYEIEAQGGVVIVSPPYTAYGDKAVYDVATGQATLTGQRLRIETPQESLTAGEKIEFVANANKLTASGGATAKRGTDKIAAKTMSAFFVKGADGKLALDKMAAEDDVKITTARETVYGDKGLYSATAQKAVLTGNVRIYQGESWISGTRADIDLTTGISQLSNTSDGDGRVKGVFYPQPQNATTSATGQ